MLHLHDSPIGERIERASNGIQTRDRLITGCVICRFAAIATQVNKYAICNFLWVREDFPSLVSLIIKLNGLN